MAIRLSAEDFWAFSLALYCRAPVAQACLSLQDRRAADVNLILAICWLAARGYETSDAALDAAEAAAAPWNKAVLHNLREARHRLGADFPEIGKEERQSIKHGILSVELECERVAQRQIAAALEPLVAGLTEAPARELAEPGLERYLARLSASPDAQDRADLGAILAQI